MEIKNNNQIGGFMKFSSLELANDVMGFIMELDADYLLFDMLDCKTELEFAEYVLWLSSRKSLEENGEYLKDENVFIRARLVDQARRKYGL